jgi:hypothetical protein
MGGRLPGGILGEHGWVVPTVGGSGEDREEKQLQPLSGLERSSAPGSLCLFAHIFKRKRTSESGQPN